MKREGFLMERIRETDNLYLAYYKASKGKHNKSSVLSYATNLSDNIETLQRQLTTDKYYVGNYHYFTIYDPKERQICAADFPERVLHHAVMNVCHPFFERNLIYDTYATRIGKGTYAAIEKGRKAAKQFAYVSKLDVRKYFDSISHDILKEKLRHLFKDPSLLSLFDSIIDSYETSPGKGIPIGNLTSQYFANYYLSSLDHYAKETLSVPVYIRYMDDILLFANTKEEAVRYSNAVCVYCEQQNQLHFKLPILSKTETGVSFLGYRIFPNKLLLNHRSKVRFTKKIKQYQQLLDNNDWTQRNYMNHITPLLSFVEKAFSKGLRKKLLYG